MYFTLYTDTVSMILYFLAIVIMIASIIVQTKVNTTFHKYSSVLSRRGITGAQAAQMVLEKNGVIGCVIERTSGHLTDHFDPRTNVIRLSEAVYGSTSVAAIGVAAHEAGHAVQYAKNYAPIKVRASVLPAAQLGSRIAIPAALFGVIFSLQPIIYIGIILFAAVTLFQLITLPVELDASRRALIAVHSPDMLSTEETKGARRVLTVAALTYVAALASSILQLLRLLALANRNRRD